MRESYAVGIGQDQLKTDYRPPLVLDSLAQTAVSRLLGIDRPALPVYQDKWTGMFYFEAFESHLRPEVSTAAVLAATPASR